MNYNWTSAYGAWVNGERRKTTPVGMFKPNAWGLFDMHGNVWEWCADGYSEYEHPDEIEDPKGDESASSRVLRGGSSDNPPRICRAACRFRLVPANHVNNSGFRVCLDF